MSAARVFVCIVLAAAAALPRPSFAANRRAEAAAVDAIKKTEADFLEMNYTGAALRLDKALRACGAANCSTATQAALLRDLGTMQFRQGDAASATKSFSGALKLAPTLDVNPSYDAPDLRAAWRATKASLPPPPAPPRPRVAPPPTFPQPTGDFSHTPAAEQTADTPLPIYVEGAPAATSHVIVRYKGSTEGADKDWSHVDLARVGVGWGGVIPCEAIAVGTMRYYVQAYDKDMDPVGANGDAKKPYQVPIREDLAGAPPHLPAKPAPKSCREVVDKAAAKPTEPAAGALAASAPSDAHADCPPGMPGCGKHDAARARADDKPEGHEVANGERDEAPARTKVPRLWVGGSLALDVFWVPTGNNLCLLRNVGTPHAGTPANEAFIYCTDSSGQDFPTRDVRTGPVQNTALFNQGQAGHSDGGLFLGTMHLTVSADAAVTDNVLLGARAGVTFNAYPGQAASTDGHAAKAPLLYLEARGTYVFGKGALARPGIAPVVFGGVGYGELDASVSGTALLPPAAAGGAARKVPVSLWVTSGPFFGVVGGGARWVLPGLRWAVSGAVRVNLAGNGAGVIASVGPEVSVQYGL